MKKDGLNLFDWKHTEEKDGYETTLFLIPNLGGREFRGTIEVFVGEMFSNVTYSTDYMLYIKYLTIKLCMFSKNTHIFQK